MPLPPTIEDCPNILIVEGYSDLLFYAELLEFLNRRVFIKPFNGRSDLYLQLEAFLTPQLLAEKSAIAVIVDADNDPAAAVASLPERLSKLTNQRVTDHGRWTVGTPKIGFFVTPDGKSKGEIETLVWRAFAKDRRNQGMVRCIEDFLQCSSLVGFVPRSQDKGRISALLGARFDDDPRLGPGARAKVFDFSNPEFEGLRLFLSGF